MKQIVILLLAISTLASCAQQKTNEKKHTSMIPYPEEFDKINAENYVDKIVSKITKYDKQIKYFVRPTQTNCVFELLVNDIPIYKDYTIEKLSTPVEINSEIFKSGPQTITVRMYPIGDAIKDAYGTGETITTLQRNSNVSIKVVKYDAFNISDELEDEVIVLQHNSPTNKQTDEFIGAGLPYYEYTFTFNAKVPYDLKGWNEGQDLTKFDKEELEAAVVNYYERLRLIYINNDKNTLAKIVFADNLRVAQANYRDREYLKDNWKWFRDGVGINDKDFFDFQKNTNLTFFGNGKIVSLRYPSLEPVDKRLRGKSSFGFLYKEDDRRKAKFIGVFLYLPKGASLDKLQMIR